VGMTEKENGNDKKQTGWINPTLKIRGRHKVCPYY